MSLAATGIMRCATVELLAPDGKRIARKQLALWRGEETLLVRIPAAQVQLWWPIGLGSQPLYTAIATIYGEGDEELDARSARIGLRRAQLLEEPLEDLSAENTSFTIAINNVPVFCQGVNWIPCAVGRVLSPDRAAPIRSLRALICWRDSLSFSRSLRTADTT